MKKLETTEGVAILQHAALYLYVSYTSFERKNRWETLNRNPRWLSKAHKEAVKLLRKHANAIECGGHAWCEGCDRMFDCDETLDVALETSRTIQYELEAAA